MFNVFAWEYDLFLKCWNAIICGDGTQGGFDPLKPFPGLDMSLF